MKYGPVLSRVYSLIKGESPRAGERDQFIQILAGMPSVHENRMRGNLAGLVPSSSSPGRIFRDQVWTARGGSGGIVRAFDHQSGGTGEEGGTQLRQGDQALPR